MNSCKTFSRKYPIVLVVLSFLFIWGLLKLMRLMPDMPFNLAISEGIMAVCVFIFTFLFMGKEKLSFNLKGLGYAFRSLRGYYIFMIFISVLTVVATIVNNIVVKHVDASFQPVMFVNILIGCIFIGIVEEFSFRGLMFGGLLQKFGNTKKGIVLAAVISGMIFGFAHVMDSVIGGEVIDAGTAATAILKTFQCAIFGIILAFIYYKTRNIYVVALLHALDDFMLMLSITVGNTERVNYVGTDNMWSRVGMYALFTVILIPCLIRSIKNVKPGEAVPFDDEFLPRKVEFEKRA